MLKYTTGPSLSDEDFDEIIDGPQKVRVGLFFLIEVSQLGIVVIRDPKVDLEDSGAFIPWSSVMVMVGPPNQQETPKQPAGNEEAAQEEGKMQGDDT